MAVDRGIRIADACRQTGHVAREARSWIARNKDRLAGDVAVLDRDMRRSARALSRLQAAASQPMGVGVYGPSQSGKSYLISALASPQGQPLMACFGPRQVDFVRELNPEGEKESTGLVTRFSIREPEIPAPDDFPVLLRLLSDTDLIKVIGNTFFLDTNEPTVNVIDGARVRERLNSLKDSVGESVDPRFTEDDAFDLQEYFTARFGTFEYVKQLGINGFWEGLERFGGRLPLDRRLDLLSLLWGDVPAFTELYRRLRRVLEQLDFAGHIHASLDALSPREHSVLDVATLQGLGGNGADGPPAGAGPVTVQRPGGQRIALDRNVLTAIVAELSIRIAEKPWGFLDHADLLDFPGARSRLDISGLTDYVGKPGALEGLFLRGKVAYLFDRYMEAFELSAMVLCLAPGNQEVRSLPGTVADWIAATQGSRPDLRRAQRNGLMLVLSKFDLVFKDKAGQSESSDARWSTRLKTALEDFLGKSHDWPNDWDGQPFRQTFWLRNPRVQSKDLFDYSGEHEAAIRASEVDRLARYKVEYLNNTLVQRHFLDPEQAWEAAFRLNDGGVSYLAECLVPVCQLGMKLDQIEGRLSQVRAGLLDAMIPHYDSGDTDQELDRRLARLEQAFEGLHKCIEGGRFWNLLGALQVSEADLVEALLRNDVADAGDEGGPANGAASSARRARPSTVMARVPGFGRSRATAAETVASGDSARDADRSESVNRIVSTAMALWARGMANVMQNEAHMRAFGAEEPSISVLSSELLAGAQRQALPRRLGQAVEGAVSLAQLPRRANVLAAKLASEEINQFVFRMGFDRMPIDERPRVLDENGQEIPVFVPPEAEKQPTLGLSEHPGGDQEGALSAWFASLYALVEQNVVGGSGGAANIEENRALGLLIEQLRS